MLLNFVKTLIMIFILVLESLQTVEGFPTFDSGGSARKLLCLAKSSEMRNYLNESVDPCEDFHDFACGNFRKLNPAPTKPYENSIFLTMTKALDGKITKHFVGNDDADTQLDQTVKDFYRSCVNIASLESSYKTKLKEIVSEFGKMPALEGDMWRESEFDWSKTIGEIASKYNIKLLVGCKIKPGDKENYLSIYIPPLGLKTTQMYTEPEYQDYRKSYQRRMEINMRIFLGLEKTVAQQTAKEIFDFEAGFAIATSTKVADDSKANKPVIIDEVQYRFAPDLNIIKLLVATYGEIPSAKVYDLIEGDSEKIRSVFRNTPKSVVANYVFYHLVKNFILNSRDLQITCLQKTREYFPHYIDNMIFRKYFNHKTTKDVEALWNSLKSTFANDLNSGKLEWLKGDDRKGALLKLEAIKLEISSCVNTNFTEQFGLLTLNNHDYIANLKSIYALKAIKSKQQIHQAVRVLRHIESIQNLPYTIHGENKIIVPVSILQPYYLWSNSYPNALKFSTLGVLLSHELIHIFVADGLYHNCRDHVTSNHFNRRSQCFKEQYKIIFHNKFYLSHINSQSECVADTAVISLAYAAYLKWSADSLNSQGLELMPRLEYTSKQLFFISYGQMLCSDSLEFIDSYFGFTDYVIDKYHINGPLSNYEEFAKEFKCSFGSAMNPTQKCTVY